MKNVPRPCQVLSALLTLFHYAGSIRFSHPIPRHSSSGAQAKQPTGMVVNCTELYFRQQMDHFGPSPGTFEQRYFLYDDYYKPGGPMFFYLGNEADVTLYVNATGLMWENAQEFGALIIFAEHRYYGKSQLFPDEPLSNLAFLSVEQALYDYVVLVDDLKESYGFAETDAVIGFGGSYGGMLASWGRFKYPHVWDGCIAGSAPIITFEDMKPPAPTNFFAEGVTYDVTQSAGSSEFCETNLRKAFAGQGLVQMKDYSLLRE